VSAAVPSTSDEGEKSDKVEKAETAEEGDRKLPKEPTNMGEARKAAVVRVVFGDAFENSTMTILTGPCYSKRGRGAQKLKSLHRIGTFCAN
jgi:hypothetical protein